MYLCIFVCIYVCIYVSLYISMYLRIYLYIYVSTYLSVSMYLCMHFSSRGTRSVGGMCERSFANRCFTDAQMVDMCNSLKSFHLFTLATTRRKIDSEWGFYYINVYVTGISTVLSLSSLHSSQFLFYHTRIKHNADNRGMLL
jgi:hypothetical protein